MTEKEFIEKIGSLAAQDMKVSGVLASITVAQACLASITVAQNLQSMQITCSG